MRLEVASFFFCVPAKSFFENNFAFFFSGALSGIRVFISKYPGVGEVLWKEP